MFEIMSDGSNPRHSNVQHENTGALLPTENVFSGGEKTRILLSACCNRLSATEHSANLKLNYRDKSAVALDYISGIRT